MIEENKINALVNIGQSKVIEKLYDDLISLPSKNLGLALSTIIDLGNTVLWPVKWVNERTRIYFQNNLKKYEEALNQIPKENITIVPTEISMPILQRFTYVSNDELSNAFVKLLSSASSTETINKAHPGFIYVIDRLSPDEAKILQFLKTKNVIPRIDIKYFEIPASTIYNYVAIKETGLESLIQLSFPNNLGIYIDNLVSLGLIELQGYFYTELEKDYIVLQNTFKEKVNSFKKEGVTDEVFKRQIRTDKKMYLVTEYGQLFIEACIK